MAAAKSEKELTAAKNEKMAAAKRGKERWSPKNKKAATAKNKKWPPKIEVKWR